MEHVVFFPAPDGAPAFHRVASLEDAVRLVEHLRNVEGVSEVSVHPLGAEVPLAFRAWYRVEVPTAAAQAPGEAPVEAPAAAEPVAVEPEPVAVEPEPVPLSVVPAQAADEHDAVHADGHANGHAKEGVPSLGFFA